MVWGEFKMDFFVTMCGKATWTQIFVVTETGEGKKSVPNRMSNPCLTSNDVSGRAWKRELRLLGSAR